MKKTLFRLLLAVALIAVLAIPVMAQSRSSDKCVCGAAVCTQPAGTVHYDVTTWESWTNASALPAAASGSRYIRLQTDVTLTAMYELTANQVLAIDLNGHTIKGSSSSKPKCLFDMTCYTGAGGSVTTNANTRLIITDSSANKTGCLDYTNTTEHHGPGIFVEHGTVDFYGGTIRGNRSNGSGGACVTVRASCGSATSATVNMYGGTFTGGKGCTNDNGGGNVQVRDGAFNMYGGTISNGTATKGANVAVWKGEFNMHDGTITGGMSTQTPTYGGSVYIKGGTFNANGGTVDGIVQKSDTATTYNGGAFYVTGSAAKLVVNGTTINGSTTVAGNATNGGAVLVENSATFEMKSGTIYGGDSVVSNGTQGVVAGGALLLKTTGNTMTGGTIIAGTAGTPVLGSDNVLTSGYHGTVHIAGSGDFTVNGANAVIDARGKYVEYGGCVFVNSGTLNLQKGTFYGGTATASGGGAVAINGPVNGTVNAKFNMTGGLISGGTSTSKNAMASHGGAAVNVGGVMTMTGGTITGGVSESGRGGGIRLRSTGSLTISGSAKVYGNTGGDVFVTNGRTVTLGGSLTDDAWVGITMEDPTATLATGADEASCDHFFYNDPDKAVGYNGGDLVITNSAVSLNGNGMLTMEKALTRLQENDVLRLCKDMASLDVTQQIYLDLNGNTLNQVNIAQGVTLYAFDSATADYNADDCGKISKKTGDGTIADVFVNLDKHRYLTLEEAGVYTFYRFYLAVTHSVLTPDAEGLQFKTMLKCSPQLAEKITDYGINLMVDGKSYLAEGDGDISYNATVTGGENVKITRTQGLTVDNARAYSLANQQINTYMKLGDRKITSTVKSRSMKAMVESVLQEQWGALSKQQKELLKGIYAEYNTDDHMESWKKIELLKVTKINTYTAGYARVNVNPTADMFGVVGLTGYGDEGSRKVQSVSTDNPLVADCLAVRDGEGDLVILVSVDSGAVSNNVGRAVAKAITEKYGIPEGRIMINSNHQHSSPVGVQYENYLTQKLTEGIEAALADMQTVTAMDTQTVDLGSNQYNFVRNLQYQYARGTEAWTDIAGAMYTPHHDDAKRKDIEDYFGLRGYLSGYETQKVYESESDGKVQLLRIQRQGQQPLVLVNFQMHPLLLNDADSETYYNMAHGDVIGLLRNQLSEKLDCDVMYMSGAGGNLQPSSGVDSNKNAAKMLTLYTEGIVSNAIYSRIQDSAWANVLGDETSGVRVSSQVYNCDVRFNIDGIPSWLRTTNTSFKNLTDAQILEQIEARAAQLYNIKTGQYTGNSTTDDLNNYGIYSKYHAKYIVIRAKNQPGDKKPLHVSTISIGDVAFAVAPYEMFDENGVAIKGSSPYTMTIVATMASMPTSTYSSISNGYVPSQRAFNNGGYSTDIVQYAAGTGEKLAQNFVNMFEAMKGN